MLLRDDEPGYLACSNARWAPFLDGLIVHRRGRDESLRSCPVELHISNNVVLKKLQVAFELKDTDLHAIFGGKGLGLEAETWRRSACRGTRTCAAAATSSFAIS